MISPDHIDDSLISEGGDDTMELANNLLDETNSNSEHTEQVPPGDESDAFMEVTPTEVAVAKATAEDMSLQEKVCGDGTKDATKASENDASEKVENKGTAEGEKADVFDELVDLDNYLDTLMLDITMSIVHS